MQYELLMGGDCLLENRVNFAMRHGWRPVGGVAVAMADQLVGGEMETRPRFFQAMVHEDSSARTVLEMEEENEHTYELNEDWA